MQDKGNMYLPLLVLTLKQDILQDIAQSQHADKPKVVVHYDQPMHARLADGVEDGV